MSPIDEVPRWDDETAVDALVELEEQAVVPPALPLPLRRVVRSAESWITDLPEEARAILESARNGRADWPRVDRPIGAIAVPTQPIPSLRTRRDDDAS